MKSIFFMYNKKLILINSKIDKKLLIGIFNK